MSAPPTVEALLALRARGEIRRWGDWLEGAGRSVAADLVAAARRKGADVPDNWQELPGKKLLKACLARSQASQVRTRPIARDEAFDCLHCGVAVPIGGRRPRDHCPACLHSLHVDVVPGDRAEPCHGLLVPMAAERSEKGWMILYRCDRCGASRRNRALDDVEPPDSADRVRDLVVRGARTD